MTDIKRKISSYFTGRSIYSIVSVIVLVSIVILGSVILGPKIVKFAEDPEKMREVLGSNDPISYLIFIGIQFIQVVFAFIPGEVVEVSAGYIYGTIKGTLLCLVGVAPATALIFWLTRLLGHKFTAIMIDSRDLKRLKFLKDERKLTLLFFLLYFLPGTPKDLITYFAGVTKIKFGTFLFLSTVCRLPSVLTSTLAGSQLGEENYLSSVIIFAVTGIIAAGGWTVYTLLTKRNQKKNINIEKEKPSLFSIYKTIMGKR